MTDALRRRRRQHLPVHHFCIWSSGNWKSFTYHFADWNVSTWNSVQSARNQTKTTKPEKMFLKTTIHHWFSNKFQFSLQSKRATETKIATTVLEPPKSCCCCFGKPFDYSSAARTLQSHDRFGSFNQKVENTVPPQVYSWWVVDVNSRPLSGPGVDPFSFLFCGSVFFFFFWRKEKCI